MGGLFAPLKVTVVVLSLLCAGVAEPQVPQSREWLNLLGRGPLPEVGDPTPSTRDCPGPIGLKVLPK